MRMGVCVCVWVTCQQLFLKGKEEDKEKRRKRIKRKGEGGVDSRKGGDNWGDNSKSGKSRGRKKTHWVQ